MSDVKIDRETAKNIANALWEKGCFRLSKQIRAALDAPPKSELIQLRECELHAAHLQLVCDQQADEVGRLRDKRFSLPAPIPPPAQPDTREAFEAWARTRYGLDDRALELSTDGHYLRSPVDVASEAFKAWFAAGRGR